MQRLDLAKNELIVLIKHTAADLLTKIDNLVKADAGLFKDIEKVNKYVHAVEEKRNADHAELETSIQNLRENTDAQFEELITDFDALHAEDARLKAEDARQDAILDQHSVEIARLEQVKVDLALWQENEEIMDNRITREVEQLGQKLQQTREELSTKVQEEADVREKTDAELQASLKELAEREVADVERLTEALQTGFKKAEADLVHVRKEVLTDAETRVNTLAASVDERLAQVNDDVDKKDAALHTRVAELTKKTEVTFQGLSERMEEMARLERARLGTIEKAMNETNAKLRSDCRADLERVRGDYEQDTARLDADLGDLHMKYDVTKQEINFFQTRIAEQKEWSQTKIAELTTATKASQVDAQEGLAANTKMLHALRDDVVGFREKMAKYISILQQSSDTQGDAINSLEAHRNRMRVEIDALIGDHKAYTVDMDGWADDVRVKVERLFRAMEPQRAEWRVMRAAQRGKELRKPLAVKSPSFALKGLREVQMEFYPDGHNTSPEGKAILRCFLPPNAHVRYQCWVGKFPCGSQEWRPGNNSLHVDLVVDKWKDQISEDGTLSISMEVLCDHRSQDESLAREVRVESA